MNDQRIGSNILLTGLPGCGKTTLIEKIVRRIGSSCTGFITREIREAGRRVGFAIITLSGKHATMAHIDIRGRNRVGRYGINLQQIDRLAVPAMVPLSPHDIVVVDEIGKMECLSDLFRKTVVQALDGPNVVFGSIPLKGEAFIGSIKRRSDVHLISVTVTNRNSLESLIMKSLLR